MSSGGLKRYVPRGLFNRAVLILVIPILLIQGVVAIIFIQRHYAGVTRQMTQAIGLEILYAVDTVEAAATLEEASSRLDALAVPLGLFLSLDPDRTIGEGDQRLFFDVSGGSVVDTLRDVVGRAMSFDLISDTKVAYVQVQTERGVLLAEIPRRRIAASNPHLLLVWMLGSSLILTGIAVLFLRNQITPIRRLAAAAEAFGKGRSVPFRPRGADEVRRAGAAFLAMRARIERQIEQRTRMLTGVSHDLRTPLTRMKLALAMADATPEVQELARDVQEMERMLEAFLAFARGEGSEESVQTDVRELAESLISDNRRSGHEIRLELAPGTPDSLHAIVRPVALRRALQNLIDNARRHAGNIGLTVMAHPNFLEFSVDDDGPGIPVERREEVLRPFVRLDTARNQDMNAGVGLGLAITLDVARAHGGSLVLETSGNLGGLRARLRIPR